MNFDFALVLVVLTLVAGIGWFIDKVWFASDRQDRVNAAITAAATGKLAQFAKEAPSGIAQELTGGLSEGMTGELTEEQIRSVENLPMWADLSRSMFPVLAFVLVLRSFIVEPFQIPSGSMIPTLKVGDFILVNKFSYGLRLPVINTKIVPIADPQRGDVVVFKFPNDPSINYIKRLVGVPGDVIAYRNKTIFINGVAQKQTFVADLPPDTLISENLSGVEHQIYTTPSRLGVEGEWTVPEGKYFVMGDNRDNSNDSRYWQFVPDSLMVGKAFAVWMFWKERLSVPDFTQGRLIK